MGAALASVREPEVEERQLLEEQLGLRCAAAARALARADVLLLCTGAGFSADSGLAVYADIAGVPAYQALGLKYHDLCRPHWLSRDPELFYGFWGACHNDYREAQPHDGYDIVRRWRDERFRDTPLASCLHAKVERLASTRHATEPHHVQGAASGFFVFTSNVDAHSFDFFEAYEVRECHGNTEVWQCGQPCCTHVWRAPADAAFLVDKETMRAPERRDSSDAVPEATAADGHSCERSNGAEASAVPPHTTEAAAKERSDATYAGESATGNGDAPAPREPARAGQTHLLFGRRQQPLCHMPKPAEKDVLPFADNWPRCPKCQGLARPAILMFGDSQWLDNEAQSARWEAWLDATGSLAREAYVSGRRLRVLVLEIGCGGNVRTVRHNTESAAEQLGDSKAHVTVVRVNLDFPFADSSPTHDHHDHIGILGSGLQALRKIDAALRELPEDAADVHRRDAPELSLGQNSDPVSSPGSAACDASFEPECPTGQKGATWVASQLGKLGPKQGLMVPLDVLQPEVPLGSDQEEASEEVVVEKALDEPVAARSGACAEVAPPPKRPRFAKLAGPEAPAGCRGPGQGEPNSHGVLDQVLSTKLQRCSQEALGADPEMLPVVP